MNRELMTRVPMTDDELREVLEEASRSHAPLTPLPMNRWMGMGLWALRLYVLAMLVLVGLKFAQMAVGGG